MKKRARALLKNLEKLGVKLNSDGSIDFSKVENENLRKKLENNLEVYFVLMQKDLEFEFPHREEMMKKAQEYKKRL